MARANRICGALVRSVLLSASRTFAVASAAYALCLVGVTAVLAFIGGATAPLPFDVSLSAATLRHAELSVLVLAASFLVVLLVEAGEGFLAWLSLRATIRGLDRLASRVDEAHRAQEGL